MLQPLEHGEPGPGEHPPYQHGLADASLTGQQDQRPVTGQRIRHRRGKLGTLTFPADELVLHHG